MKKYIDAELEVVVMGNDVIATSLRKGEAITSGEVDADAAERLSIWE